MSCSEEDAFRNSVESITGPISRIISREGMPGVYNALDDAGKKEFEKVRIPLRLPAPVKGCPELFYGLLQVPAPHVDWQWYCLWRLTGILPVSHEWPSSNAGIQCFIWTSQRHL